LLLGNIFREAGQPDQARNCYGACRELAPDNVTALICLGNLARDQRRSREARLWHTRAWQLRPNDPHIQSNLAVILGDAGDTAGAIRLLESSLRLQPAPLSHSNLLLTLHYDSSVAPERLADEHRVWAGRYAREVPRLSPANDFEPERKLRLGFVSADFKQHPVGRLIEALWRHLDGAQFEVAAYDTGTRPDSMTERLRQLAGRWRSLKGLNDDAAAELIRGDRVDVLFDLAGHSAGNRLLVFARKPSPVQITWFGYPNTTGLAAVDWRLTDAVSDPPGECEERYVERLLWLPQAAWIYRAPEEDFPLQPLPFTRGLPFTFGSLNNPAKASEASLAAWEAILRQVPESRLVLLAQQDEDCQQLLRERFQRAGIQPARVCLVPQGAPRQFYQYHYEIDLMLDPFPYNGAVTTADALWMGVPVLSLRGHTYVSRQGACLLGRLGLGEWICADADEYVRLAAACARNPLPLAALSETLRSRLQNSPFMDYRRFATDFAAAIRSAWLQKCAQHSGIPAREGTRKETGPAA
jgi:predicted O-linked N-acetylglucosamine transferase (SPINDLY family)